MFSTCLLKSESVISESKFSFFKLSNVRSLPRNIYFLFTLTYKKFSDRIIYNLSL